MADETGGDEEAERPDLERQMEVASDAIRAAVLRLLKEGEALPRVIVFAVARVAGELGAATALAGGEDAETDLQRSDAAARLSRWGHAGMGRAGAAGWQGAPAPAS